MDGILSSIFTEIGKYLVEHSIHQANYLFRFKNIVDDLKKEDENLRLIHDRVKEEVERAKRNTEEIEKDVEKWLMDVQNVLEEIQGLKDEIELNKTFLCGRCPNWRWRYKLGRRAVKKTSEMSKLRESGDFSRVSHPTTLPGVEGPKDFISFKPMEDAFSQIMEALKNDNMVGLYGMGGVGKTTLAKVVGKEAKEKKLFDEVVMVTATQNPNIKNIQSQIANLLGLKFEDEEETLRAQRLCLRLKMEKKILIILDDVWRMLELTTIGIPFGDAHKGCTILLTTRRQEVCISMRCQLRIHLNILSDDEALTLFKKHANICDSPELNAVAKEVVGECGCLPIAIKAIGSALREKDVDEWKVVSEKLKMSKFPDIETVDQNVYACLKLSYDYLKAEETKFCFLLCSLFPEDYEIDLEELLRYGLGLGLYGDANTIEAARRQLRVTINNLKSSCLLLDAKEGFVKMHDLVRDVALWITSIRQSNLLNGENVFMVKAGMGLTEWPKHEGLEQCTAISLMKNDIEHFPNGLVCPKLKVLLLEGNVDVEVSEEFFEEMKTLKVASLTWVHLSLNSLQSLTNLVTLQLIDCRLSDISSIKKLAQLEILRLKDSGIVKLPEELGELSKLRMLDITDCRYLKRIPANVIPRLSRLEEFYIGEDSFKAWEVEGTSAEQSNASLSELSQLYCLTILSLRINVLPCLPKEFVLPTKLLRYDISVNDDHVESYPTSSTLNIRDIEATSLIAFKALCEKVEYLKLVGIKGCCQNMVPSIDETGLNELKRLSIRSFDELECIIDTTQQQDVASTAFSSLESLDLENLQNLRYIWKGPTQQVSLQSLTVVIVRSCDQLRYLFTLSLARSLLQLEELIVWRCGSLEHIVEIKEAEENVGGGGGNDVIFPKLRKLQLDLLENFINFFDSENYSSTWPALQELSLNLPLNSTTSFVAQLEANVLQTSKEKLRVLEVGISDQLCNTVLAQLRHDLQNLEELSISSCRVQVLFQLEGVEQELSLPSLKELELYDLEELECLCKGPTHLLSLPNLIKLKVWGCNRLRHMFSPSLARNFMQLEELTIRHCGELEQIFNEDDAAEYNQTLLKDHLQSPLLFPTLSRIEIWGCDKLKSMFPASMTHLLSLQNLTTLKLSNCDGLTHLFSSTTLVRNLLRLESIDIENCKELEQIIVEDHTEDDHVQVGLFLNLSSISVKKCGKLKTLFPATIARNLLRLESIDIKDCGELEQIIVEDHTEDDHVQLGLFLNLSSISVRGCGKLKTLFPAITIARSGLQKLKTLIVGSSSQLEELFGHKNEADITSHREMVLPQLEQLSLEELASLVNFCPVGYHFIFPSLSGLTVTKCPKITTRFSVEQNRSVHAEAEAPQTGKEDVDMEQPPPETTLEIKCRGWKPDDLQSQLESTSSWSMAACWLTS